jgi:hypothetical protein
MQIQAIAYSTLGGGLCTAAKDTLKLWDLDPVGLNISIDTGWDKVEDMKVRR